MSTGYQIRDQVALHYLIIQVVDWIDIFTRQVYRDMVIDSLRYCLDNKGLQLFGYVIMSNHVHLIANSPGGSIKRYSARF
jgi:REP element-mobilizing transposase RayT